MLIDKRLLSVGDVRGYAEMAKTSGRKYVLFDVDAPLEDSLVGVLERTPGGADPLPPFDVVAKGFEGVRLNRDDVINLFSDPTVGTYHLYGTRPDGTRVEAGRVSNGKLEILDEALFETAITGPGDTLAKTRITQETIDRITSKLDPARAAKI